MAVFLTRVINWLGLNRESILPAIFSSRGALGALTMPLATARLKIASNLQVLFLAPETIG